MPQRCIASTAIDFTTSGVFASIEHINGHEVKVLGLAGSEFVEREPSFPSITADSEKEAGGVSAAYLTLPSAELASVSFTSSFLVYEVVRTYRLGSDGEAGVFVYGNQYEPPLTVSMYFCMEIVDLKDGVFP